MEKIDLDGIRDYFAFKKNDPQVEPHEVYKYYGLGEKRAYNLLDEFYSFVESRSGEVVNSAMATMEAIDFIEKKGLVGMEAVYIFTAAVFDVGYHVGSDDVRRTLRAHIDGIVNLAGSVIEREE